MARPPSSLPPEQHLLERRPGRHRQRRRGARAAAAPRGRDGEGRGRRSRRGARGPRERARGAGVALPGDAGRSRDHSRVGPAVLPALRPGPVGAAPALRHSGRGSRRSSTPGVPERPRRHELEQNDVAVLLRSDSLDAIAAAEKALFDDLGVLTKTTVRRGFAGGGLPSKLAVAAGVPGADLIPTEAELFLGFTSTLRENLGPSRIANLETLGLARLPEGYFTHGTHMHLSHIHENLEAWYVNSSHDDRVHTTFRPGLEVPGRDADGAAGAGGGLDRSRRPPQLPVHGAIGHSGALQTASRLERRRSAPTAPSTRPASRSRSGPTSTRSTTRSPGAPTARLRRSRGRCPLRRLQPDERRLPPRPHAMDGVLPTGRRCRSSRGPRGRASTASSARRGGRTSSSRRAPTARSRSPSCRA